MQPSSQLTRSLDGIETELLVQSFSDRVLVLITQVGKVGNLVCYVVFITFTFAS